MQLDLLINRADDVVNICEMKSNKSALTITKAYAQKLVSPVSTLNPEKAYHLTLISVLPPETQCIYRYVYGKDYY